MAEESRRRKILRFAQNDVVWTVMMKFTIKEIIRITGGKLVQGEGTTVLRSISINSKDVKKGSLFIAIKGHRLDGHKFIKDAVRRGAETVLISKKNAKIPPGIAGICVTDTTKALGEIARAHRKKFSVPVIAITGSAGKTTAKELIASVLKSHFRVLKNKGTENNHWGVALTLLRLKPAYDIVIVELGTNCPGDISWLTYISCPTIAIMTNIGESHLQLLKSPGRVFKEKKELVAGMEGRGTVILNADDVYLKTIPIHIKKHNYITFGIRSKADYKAANIEIFKNKSLSFCVNRTHKFTLRSPVISNVYNALIAISCGRLFNLSYNNISSNTRKQQFKGQRQSIKRYGRFWLINDTYNANPVSFRSAIKTLSLLEAKGRRILVCGDMLELGGRSEKMHRLIGKLALRAGIDVILTYGREASFITAQVKRESKGFPAFHYKNLSQLHKKLCNSCSSGDVILVKGSRSMRMERTVDFLTSKVFK